MSKYALVVPYSNITDYLNDTEYIDLFLFFVLVYFVLFGLINSFSLTYYFFDRSGQGKL